VKNTPCTQSPALHPIPVSRSRYGAVESQKVYGNGLDRLWRVLAVMLNPIGIAPHRVEGKRLLLRP